MKNWLTAALLAALIGCAARPVVPPHGGETQWQGRQHALQGLQQWRLSGRVGVESGNDAWNGSLRWNQSGSDYAITLTSPFGQGGVQISGNASQSELHLDKGEVVVGDDAEALIYRQFGWRLPVKGLRYWIRGLPDPGLDRKLVLDQAGRVEKLRQSGWEVDFKRYVRVDGVDLPGKIFVSHPQLRVRLVVDRWELNG